MGDTTSTAGLDQEAWAGLARTFHEVEASLDAVLLSHCSLGTAWYEILVRLSRQPAETRINTLASTVRLSTSRVSRVLDAMVQRGFVSRTTDGSDGRASLVTLTEAGRQFCVQAQAEYESALRTNFLDKLTSDEKDALTRIWQKLSN